MMRAKASPVITHIAAWLLFMSFPLLFMTQGKALYHITSATVLYYIQFCLLYVFLFYIHTYWLIPRFFLRKKYLVYGIVLALLFGAVYVVKPFDDLVSQNRGKPENRMGPPPGDRMQPLPGPPPEGNGPGNEGNVRHFDITSIFIFVMVIGLGTAVQSIRQWQRSEKRALQAETERANAELSFLKAQINPHFLYNTLNNIYTLCITNGENAAESILKLSNIMRYITDEAEGDFVPLEDELACTTDFIDLQKLRLGKKVTLNYSIEGDTRGHRITPLILITFVENVFKYGLSNHHASTIDILIKVEADTIVFYSKNQVFEQKQPEHRKGVGLENTKKRLEYLYGDQHNLTITDVDGFFTVVLTLKST